MNPQLYFQLFACCLPVKGSSRSVVCDIQRNDYQLIPNILYDILIDYKNQTIESVLAHFEKESHEDILEYF